MLSKKIILIGSAGFLDLLAKADGTTDFKALFSQSVDELAASENKIQVYLANQEEANRIIADLNNKLTLTSGLQEQLENANDFIKKLKIELADSNKSLSDLELEFDRLKECSTSAGTDSQAELEEAYAQIAELGKQLDLQQKTRSQQGILVEVGGTHKVLIGKNFTIKKEKYTAQQVADSPDLLKHLHETGSGSLVEPSTGDEESAN